MFFTCNGLNTVKDKINKIYHFLKTLQKNSSDLAVRTMFKNRCMQESSLQEGVSMLYKLFSNPPARLSYQAA